MPSYGGKGQFTLPEDHRPGMRVPTGGSSCANCKWLSTDREHCGNRYFVKWLGTSKLPAPADSFCSDWWEQ